MQVILLQRVHKLGQMGEVVKVKEGFARNFLLPQGKAMRASEANIAAFEAKKADLAQRNDETRAEAQQIAESLDGKSFVIIRSASDAGALYGSVTPRDIAAAFTEQPTLPADPRLARRLRSRQYDFGRRADGGRRRCAGPLLAHAAGRRVRGRPEEQQS